MKWTEETKELAISLLKDGKSYEEISGITGMSWASVRLLYYSEFKKHELKVRCELCKKEFKSITEKHLKNYHNISFSEYTLKFPNSKTRHTNTDKNWAEYSNPNKGKTYEEIYGKEEGDKKRAVIAQKQIGRPAAKHAGTGISGIRKDTGMFARSTYEANIDRIFKFENKAISGEFDVGKTRFNLVRKNGEKISYMPDRTDIDGLFSKNAFLEIKGFMKGPDWEKITLFREQYPNEKLLVISKHPQYLDVDMKELEKKYKPLIPLWEGEFQNYRRNPELYDINYVITEKEKLLSKEYSQQVHNSIIDEHKIFIANKLISFAKVSLGEKIYVKELNLLAISNRRKNASKSSCSRYNYELWEIISEEQNKYYVCNYHKAVDFYAYKEEQLAKLLSFFKDNNIPSLKFGPKFSIEYRHICKKLMDNFNRKDLLECIERSFTHASIEETVFDIELLESIKTQKQATNDKERWKITTDKRVYHMDNMTKNTTAYYLSGYAEKISEIEDFYDDELEEPEFEGFDQVDSE